MSGLLRRQNQNPVAFMSLLARILPQRIESDVPLASEKSTLEAWAVPSKKSTLEAYGPRNGLQVLSRIDHEVANGDQKVKVGQVPAVLEQKGSEHR